jgi:thermostable 8-oxoguanine DNA glycosylase
MSSRQTQDKETAEDMKASDYSGDLRSLLAQYTYQPDLTKRLDNLEVTALDQSLINNIVLWKVNRYVRVTDEILGQMVGLKILSAGEHRKAEAEINALLELDGVDLPMASTILRFVNPKVFQIIDRHAYRAVYGKKYPLYASMPKERKVSEYFDYLDQLIELCELKKLPFKIIDRLLYVFDKENNGKL